MDLKIISFESEIYVPKIYVSKILCQESLFLARKYLYIDFYLTFQADT